MNSKFRFVNTHLESAGVPQGAQIQLAQVNELLAALTSTGTPIILAGDFNANAEPGPEHTGAVQQIVSAGFSDSWTWANPDDPGYTWPLFGEDQASGPTNTNERIDLIFTGGSVSLWFGRNPNLLSSERTATTGPWTSDHAGVVVKLQLQ
jgi:endonuclease/exonuclease/phosphatase family metal-dependent hydrolase